MGFYCLTLNLDGGINLEIVGMKENKNMESSLNTSTEEQEIDLLGLAKMLLRNWKWYVIAVPLFLALGILYLQSTPKEYLREASVLIKDDKGSGGGTVGGLAELSELANFGMKSMVDNEILIFQSNTLLTEVVSRLNLSTTYKISKGLRKQDLYGQNPFDIRFVEASINQPIEAEVQFIDEQLNFSQVETWSEGEKVKLEDFSISLNDTVDSPLGLLYGQKTGIGQEHIDEKFYLNRSGLKNTTLAYAKKLQIALANKNATIIDLSIRDEVPQRAEDLINTLIAVYNEEAVNDKNRLAINTSDFINERLIIIEKELGGVDSEIEKFKRTEGLTNITSDADMFIQETTGLKKDELMVNNQLSLAQFIKEYLSDPANRGKLIPANTGISDNTTESQIQEYNTILLQRDRLLSNSSDKNPVVRDLNKSLFAMEQNINRSVGNVIAGLNLQLDNIRARDTQTLKRIQAVPGQEKYVLSVGRQQKIKEELYLFLLNKREENALAQAITQSNARVIDSARGSDKPVAPRSLMIMAGCLFLGLLLPTGGLLLLSFMDNKVRHRDDLDSLGIPYLGDVPFLKNKVTGIDLVVEEHSRDEISEAFRIIRTNLSFFGGQDESQKVISFTSLSANSGKSFMVVNLGMSLTISNKKVVIIDLDIRKRQLSQRLSMTKRAGITHYLSGQVNNIQDLLVPATDNSNLFYIPAGIMPPNPAELLLSNRLDQLIEELRKEFDYVLIDNVPALIVADAPITNRVCDMTIFVLRAGVVGKYELPIVDKIYRSGKFNNMTLVLNGVKENKRNTNRTYGYGYGYGYGKGYFDED